MREFINTDLGDRPAVLSFTGPDAVRFLNGQVTQDVRLVMGTQRVLPSCVTDAKGKLQFRVWLTEVVEEGSIYVFSRPGTSVELEARLTRYLIADDVEVQDLSDTLFSRDYGAIEISEEQRIQQAYPKWGAELTEGMLPPEANLDFTDISYRKGCYIGQEVISRIKSAGKVNRKLTRFLAEAELGLGKIHDENGKVCGDLTSLSGKYGLGFLKRGVDLGSFLSVENIRIYPLSSD